MERDAEKQRDGDNQAKPSEGATNKKPKGGGETAEGTSEVSKGTYDKAKDDAVKDIHG